jgi:hypothetical protein
MSVRFGIQSSSRPRHWRRGATFMAGAQKKAAVRVAAMRPSWLRRIDARPQDERSVVKR